MAAHSDVQGAEAQNVKQVHVGYWFGLQQKYLKIYIKQINIITIYQKVSRLYQGLEIIIWLVYYNVAISTLRTVQNPDYKLLYINVLAESLCFYLRFLTCVLCEFPCFYLFIVYFLYFGFVGCWSLTVTVYEKNILTFRV